MNILAFDTCFSACSAAATVARPGATARIVVRFREMETGHAEALMPMVGEVMAEAGLAFAALDRIVVTNGPGTFTGLRTGVAAARALALATGKPLVAVSSLWAIARAAIEAGPALAGDEAVLVAMDARKGQVFAQIVGAGDGELTEPLLVTPEAAAALRPERRLHAVGTAAQAVAAAAGLAGRQILLDRHGQPATQFHRPDASHLLAAACRSSMSGPLLPLYLRPPDAKPQADKSLPWSPS